MSNPEYPHANTYIKRFGGWNNALKLVKMDLSTMVEQGNFETSKWHGWPFHTISKDKDYFGAFNEDYTELLYIWKVPGEIVEGNSFIIGIYMANSM